MRKRRKVALEPRVHVRPERIKELMAFNERELQFRSMSATVDAMLKYALDTFYCEKTGHPCEECAECQKRKSDSKGTSNE